MLHQVIDRRLSGKNKSIGNRERFLRRYREQIKRRGAQGGRRPQHHATSRTARTSRCPSAMCPSPSSATAPGGIREMVHPGNQEYVRGDRIQRPQGGGGGGRRQRRLDRTGTGEDDFVFRITREEFMNYFFDDLALPRLIRTQLLADAPEWKTAARRLRLRGQSDQPARGALDARRAGTAHRHGRRRARRTATAEEHLQRARGAATTRRSPKSPS